MHPINVMEADLPVETDLRNATPVFHVMTNIDRSNGKTVSHCPRKNFGDDVTTIFACIAAKLAIVGMIAQSASPSPTDVKHLIDMSPLNVKDALHPRVLQPPNKLHMGNPKARAEAKVNDTMESRS